MDPKGDISSSEMHRHRNEGIDFLRAVAIMAVIAYHYTARMPDRYLHYPSAVQDISLGALGVQLFFIISGYCIFLTLERSSDVLTFWSKRFSRLQPAYVVAIIITFLTVAYFGLPGREVTPLQAIGNFFWLTIVGVPEVDGAYWSLIVEVKYYVVLGVFFALSAHNMLAVHKWFRLFCLAGLALYIFDLSNVLGPGDKVADIFGDYALIFPHSLFFLMGMNIYLWPRLNWSERAMDISLFLAGLLVVNGMSPSFAVEIALVPLAVYFMIFSRLRIPRFVLLIGLVSYPLYLLHQNVGFVVIREMADALPSPYLRMLLAFSICLVLAVAITYGVERSWRPPMERTFLAGLNRLAAAVKTRFAPIP